MKTLKNFMAILAITLITATILIGSCFAQQPTNYLKVKGEIIGSKHTEIQIFEYDETKDEWNEIRLSMKKTKYFMRLATDKEYQVFFTADNGCIKRLHIHSGNPGMWIKSLNVDFTKTNSIHASMYQNESMDDYTVELISGNYAMIE